MESLNWRIPPNPVADDAIAAVYEADVIIVGGGHSGVCAAHAALEEGASVIVLERMSEERHSFISGGQIGHINSKFLKSRGIPEVDVIEFVTDWQLRGNNRSNASLVMKYAKNSGDCFDWVFDSLTEEQWATVEIRQMPNPEAYKTCASGIKCWVGCAVIGRLLRPVMDAFKNKTIALGARWFFGVSGEQLIVEDGRVTAAIGKTEDGSYVRFNALKGVLLAAGDFSGNADMCRELLVDLVDMEPGVQFGRSTSSASDGKGIQMGLWAGGILEPRPLSTMGGNYIYPCDTTADPIGATAALWLNSHGKRYCNEGFGEAVIAGIPGLRQPAGRLNTIFDSRIFEQVRVQQPGHMSFNYTCDNDKLRAAMDKALGLADDLSPTEGRPRVGGPMRITLHAADTLPELAEKLGYEGVDIDNFLKSVERYNEFCHVGRDEDFGKDAHLLWPIETPPFFGYGCDKGASQMLVTTGGLLTDENQNVLGPDFEPIPGLFATGNCCGARFGLQYSTPVSGVSLSIAHTLGREAGYHIASL